MKKQARKPTKVVKKASRKAAKKIARKVAKAGSALEKRLRTIEDIEEISKLKARYCNCVDGGWDRPTHDFDGVVELFTEDGVWDAGEKLRGDGREGIREFFKKARSISFAFHRITNPIIEIDGDTATGNWHVMVALTHPDGRAVWIAGIYNDEFVRTAEGWKFKRLHFTQAFQTPYERSWGVGEWYRTQAPANSENGPQTQAEN
jgi:ketosteroid isomerase-like protein